MEHQMFQCAPQTISAAQSHAPAFRVDERQLPFQGRRRKRSRKTARRNDAHLAPQQSASGSSWGAADQSEAEYESSESGKEDGEDEGNEHHRNPSYDS
jgi:hypothetical protein